MALSIKNFVSPSGVTFDAYVRVFPMGFLSKQKIQHLVSIHADSTKPADTSFLAQCEYDLAGPNIYTQIYDNLKTTPEFSGAENV